VTPQLASQLLRERSINHRDILPIQWLRQSGEQTLKEQPQFTPLRAALYRSWATVLRTRARNVGDEASQTQMRALAEEYERLAQFVEESLTAAKSRRRFGRGVRPSVTKSSGGRGYTCSNTRPDYVRPIGNGRWCRARRSE
jgi:hypothetical protein